MQWIQLHGPLEVLSSIGVTADQPALIGLVHEGQPHDVLILRASRVES